MLTSCLSPDFTIFVSLTGLIVHPQFSIGESGVALQI